VVEALRGGGISQPPVPFDPGWRFLLAALAVLLGSAAAGLALSAGNARLAPALGAGVVLAGVLVQPSGAAVVSVCGALVLLAAGLAVAAGEAGGGFEARRLARGAGALAGLVALVVLLSTLGFLFPDSTAQQVIPPKRPQTPPSEVKDRVLFKVDAERAVPLRLGVLDGYDGRGFLTPPYDSARFRRLGPAPSDGLKVTITVADLGGHLLPAPASPRGVSVTGARIEVDPRTGQLRLPKERAAKGLTYTVVAAPVPSAEALDRAGPPPRALDPFTKAPPAPRPVLDLLAQAPGADTPYGRVQFLRAALYGRVVAAGAGSPADVPPGRVVELLDGKEASPFEITAAEVLLARWAGVPARLGYGYYDPAGAAEIRPRNGATWLEAYFEGSGWVPVVGSPPRAKASFSREPKKQDPLVRPTDQLALVVYVPVRLTTVQLLYTLVRYWLVRALPVGLGLVLAWALCPSLLRGQRRWRRRRWAGATGRGAPERLLVAYAELRDGVADLNIGRPDMTALELAASGVAPDDEHTQLAWLVTRGLWGDLRRGLTEEDVKAGEDMAASVLRRLRRAQSAGSRFSALVSRASLRAPWSTEIPGAPRPGLPLAPRRLARRGLALRGLAHRLAPRRFARRPARGLAPRGLERPPAPRGLGRGRHLTLVPLAVLVALALLLVLGTVARLRPEATVPRTAGRAGAGLPGRLAPASVDGVELRREPTVERAYAEAGRSSVVAEGRLLSVRRGDDLEGSLQIAAFTPGVSAADAEVRRAVVTSIGRGRFRLTRIGQLRVYALDQPDQRFLLWFPPDGRSYNLLVARSTFDQADRVFASVVAYQRGDAAPAGLGVPVPDPRRGLPE
jgi:hypothetical protein